MSKFLGTAGIVTLFVLLSLWCLADHNTQVGVKYSGVDLTLVVKKARLWADPQVVSGSCPTSGRPSDHGGAKTDPTGTYYTLSCPVPDGGALVEKPPASGYTCSSADPRACGHASLVGVVPAADNRSFVWTVKTDDGNFKNEAIGFSYTRACCYAFCERQPSPPPVAPICTPSKSARWIILHELGAT